MQWIQLRKKNHLHHGVIAALTSTWGSSGQSSHSAIPSGKSPVVFAVSEECVKPSTRETDRDTLQQAELSAAHPYDLSLIHI